MYVENPERVIAMLVVMLVLAQEDINQLQQLRLSQDRPLQSADPMNPFVSQQDADS